MLGLLGVVSFVREWNSTLCFLVYGFYSLRVGKVWFDSLVDIFLKYVWISSSFLSFKRKRIGMIYVVFRWIFFVYKEFIVFWKR